MSEPSSTSKELRAFAQAATPSGEYGSYTNRHMQVSVPLESLIALLDETDAHAEAAAETANDRDSARTKLAELEREVERLRAEARDNYQRRLDAADAAIIQAIDDILQGGKATDFPLDMSAEWARVARAIRINILLREKAEAEVEQLRRDLQIERGGIDWKTVALNEEQERLNWKRIAEERHETLEQTRKELGEARAIAARLDMTRKWLDEKLQEDNPIAREMVTFAAGLMKRIAEGA